MFLSVSTSGYGSELTAAEKQVVSCQVCLEIDRDGALGPLVRYDWFLQKNTPSVTALP